MFTIKLVERKKVIREYEYPALPDKGDIISINDDTFFEVKYRVLSSDKYNLGVLLYGSVR